MSAVHFIELENIRYHFPADARPILHNINFAIDRQTVGLIGPNGSGKTTLFHIIMGLLKPTEGKVFFKGEVISGSDQFKTLRREVGFLFQSSDDQLFSPTVIEDVAFGPLNLGHTEEEARQIATAVLDKVGLKGFENRITHKLSGGEKKLVALATILSMDPKLLLLDEPTNNLDPETQSRLVAILDDLNLPYIIISHDWDFLAKTTAELYTLDNGHLVKCREGHIHEHRHIHPYGNRPHHHKEAGP